MTKSFEPETHPVGIVRELRERYGGDLMLQFSRYRDVPGSPNDLRVSLVVQCQHVTTSWLRRELTRLDPSEELALESRVRIAGTLKHIPMLDFKGTRRYQRRTLARVLPPGYANGMRVFFSGRSFHAYWPRLVTEREWIQFMGAALLCNTSRANIIDERWVGHRLIGGYAALRWSCNSTKHQRYPVRVPAKTLDLSFKEKRACCLR
jgi:hypothetical protein